MVNDIRCEVPAGDRCGEAAMWDHDARLLYWCDINRFLIHRLDPATGLVAHWQFAEPVVALSLTTRPGLILVAQGSRLILWSPVDDTRTDHGFILDGWPRQRLNDGRSGPDGSFWIGSMANNVGADGENLAVRAGEGALFHIGATHPPHRHKRGIGIGNTICWSPDERSFYFADTLQNTIWRYDHQHGELANETVFFNSFAQGMPDGSAIDRDGYLWNCRFGGACLVRIAPDGEIDRIVPMPVRNPTTCAFGGEDLRTLYITSAAGDERLAGSLFSLRVREPGLIGYRFEARKKAVLF